MTNCIVNHCLGWLTWLATGREQPQRTTTTWRGVVTGTGKIRTTKRFSPTMMLIHRVGWNGYLFWKGLSPRFTLCRDRSAMDGFPHSLSTRREVVMVQRRSVHRRRRLWFRRQLSIGIYERITRNDEDDGKLNSIVVRRRCRSSLPCCWPSDDNVTNYPTTATGGAARGKWGGDNDSIWRS